MQAMEAGMARLRLRLWFRYLVEQGAKDRWGDDWEAFIPTSQEGKGERARLAHQRRERLELECQVIQEAGYEGAFIMLYEILAYCREQKIPYGPGRGSVGGSLVAYCLGIHDVDPLEWGLLFERFMNPDRVSFPDVDIDISQRQRQKVIDWVIDRYQRDGQIVLRIGAFARASGRAVVDSMLAAMASVDPNAGATATNLKKCFPEKGTITGGIKVPRELAWWLENGHGDRGRFREIAEQAGWMDTLLKLDGMYTHLGKHAAGVVILREEDLPFIPQTSTLNIDTGQREMATAYDMYSLDDLGYPKWDLLGLRTLDIIADAHKLAGGSGESRDLIALWQQHRNDPDIYEVFQEADTPGIFQMDTPGFQKTLREFQPTSFDHIVQLCALYRPGALDYRRDDGKNMVEVFIDRHRGHETPSYLDERLRPILEETHGIILYQEQAMRIVRDLAGFTRGQADSLRKAISKKRPKELAALRPLWNEGCARAGIQEAVRDAIFENIEAAGRYSWNKSHAVAYAVITWLTAFFKKRERAAFYAEVINSLVGDREQQAEAVSYARQSVTFRPPDINVAEGGFGIEDDEIVFGLSGIKGLGDAARNTILVDRVLNGPYRSYYDFCRRIPSLPTDKKKALIACGAFDRLGEDRVKLLASIPKGNDAWWVSFDCGHTMRKLVELNTLTYHRCSECKASRCVVECKPVERKRWLVLEFINDQAKAEIEGRSSKPLPSDLTDYEYPSDTDLAAGEMEAMGYYISNVPLAAVNADLGRLPATYTGGEVASVREKPDKNGNVMGHLQITTPALTKQRVLMFASVWATFRDRVEKGAQLIFRGRKDGDAYLAEGCWEPGDYRHFKKIKIWDPGSEQPRTESMPERANRNDLAAMVRSLEGQGCRVRLL
jgi:DNA-directed DNA polymerase III PolC